MGNKEVICIVRKQKMLGNIKGLVISKRIVKMEQWDVHCTECGKFILTEKREHIGEDIKCIAGSYKQRNQKETPLTCEPFSYTCPYMFSMTQFS